MDQSLPHAAGLGKEFILIYKQGENSFNATVESLLLLLILCTSAWQKAQGTLRLFHVYLQNEENKCQRIYDQNTRYLQTEDWSEIPCVCM